MIVLLSLRRAVFMRTDGGKTGERGKVSLKWWQDRRERLLGRGGVQEGWVPVGVGYRRGGVT